jgi:hypothetical protein
MCLQLKGQWQANGTSIYNTNTGNVGIGTTTPSLQLNVDPCGEGGILIGNPSSGTGGYTSLRLSISSQKGGHSEIQCVKSSGSEWGVLALNPVSGNVLIGKTTQTNTTYKLDVSGKIRADEIVVNTTGADFVFEPTYKLRSLPELETFIKQNKHLPEIAPAKEMQENGVSAGEMQAKLLQKVEETTLYLIEQSKQIELLKTENIEKTQQLAIQKQMLIELKKKIEELKKNKQQQ